MTTKRLCSKQVKRWYVAYANSEIRVTKGYPSRDTAVAVREALESFLHEPLEVRWEWTTR